MQSLTDEEMVRDTEALIAHIGGLADCNLSRMVIGGHCMGGRVALLAAGSISGFKAVADFWGGNVMTAKGREAPTVIDMIKDITCPVVGFFGNDDQNPSPEDVDRLEQELNKHGIDYSFHCYEGAGHAFQNFLNEKNYREKQAEDAWQKAVAFFNEAVA
ncbi:MAG: dienelactone hydrolase family protein [Rhodospirillales bacterium]|nr:dienelactone hydrolase family protein [Rhodospirillales bacterium]